MPFGAPVSPGMKPSGPWIPRGTEPSSNRPLNDIAEWSSYELKELQIFSSARPGAFEPGSEQVPKLAALFLTDSCYGARGISEETRATLMKLKDAAPKNGDHTVD